MDEIEKNNFNWDIYITRTESFPLIKTRCRKIISKL